MTTVTISKELMRYGELVLIPKKEYENLLNFRLREAEGDVSLTSKQKNAINKARGRIAAGNFLTINELKEKLGIKN